MLNYNSSLEEITGFNNIDSIYGTLNIFANEYLTSIFGLNNLTSVGSISISARNGFTNLHGLENITVVNNLHINGVMPLTSFEGLNNLETITGYFSMSYQRGLTNFHGLESVRSVGGYFLVSNCSYLTDFTGFDSLDSIGGDFSVHENPLLTSFNGIENLNSITGDVSIDDNEELSSLNGLENVNYESIKDLSITDNQNLSVCNIQSVCGYLSDPMGSVTIYGNDTGCQSAPEIADSCGFELQCLPFGDYYFTSQEEIDNFHSDYANCYSLNGNVTISGENIKSLAGLTGVTNISGNLLIANNDSLVNFEGLNDLLSIGGNFNVGLNYYNDQSNPELIDFSGLESLERIEGRFSTGDNPKLLSFEGLNSLSYVGELFVGYSFFMESLTGLENLDSINGDLRIDEAGFIEDLSPLLNTSYVNGSIIIQHNKALASLYGLDNIQADSITFLRIIGNDVLSTCAVAGICDYITSENPDVIIGSNTEGCANIEEVEYRCTLDVKEITHENSFRVYPNPAGDEIFIESVNNTDITEVVIYNSLGQKIITKVNALNSINISKLQSGLYIIEVRSSAKTEKHRLIKN